ncbi:hypothetical protein VOLCADRAFT_91491 [Volvox carteri f. nagariensis]|uniref:Uncharacterized protein n=1 Tax=Volvox carteri f. nagariensis TaxID=3068 RepID=D8TX77_VOLCA|nr:uncharacterized protein VOLCADRAFT_91491 [Volvox carteri f. nagariensis]EFJ47860.1 hypothetical protein VOLCADRAFT_91491 [Volvox carteri f. nagariensis]|eukprot:XP_002950966.1 hypothetical protein VOLCADRAFT_91491 [Volvox carteri f. nagariensis]
MDRESDLPEVMANIPWPVIRCNNLTSEHFKSAESGVQTPLGDRCDCNDVERSFAAAPDSESFIWERSNISGLGTAAAPPFRVGAFARMASSSSKMATPASPLDAFLPLNLTRRGIAGNRFASAAVLSAHVYDDEMAAGEAVAPNKRRMVMKSSTTISLTPGKVATGGAAHHNDAAIAAVASASTATAAGPPLSNSSSNRSSHRVCFQYPQHGSGRGSGGYGGPAGDADGGGGWGGMSQAQRQPPSQDNLAGVNAIELALHAQQLVSWLAQAQDVIKTLVRFEERLIEEILQQPRVMTCNFETFKAAGRQQAADVSSPTKAAGTTMHYDKQQQRRRQAMVMQLAQRPARTRVCIYCG